MSTRAPPPILAAFARYSTVEGALMCGSDPAGCGGQACPSAQALGGRSDQTPDRMAHPDFECELQPCAARPYPLVELEREREQPPGILRASEIEQLRAAPDGVAGER